MKDQASFLRLSAWRLRAVAHMLNECLIAEALVSSAYKILPQKVAL
jgi:hypothetical protein